MYLSTIARSLGSYRGPLPPDPGPPRPLPPLRKKCGRVRLPDGRLIFVDCAHPAKPMAGLGTITACADAGTGLLKDCWKQAEQRGLGYTAISQEQLNRASTTYQRLTQ